MMEIKLYVFSLYQNPNLRKISGKIIVKMYTKNV